MGRGFTALVTTSTPLTLFQSAPCTRVGCLDALRSRLHGRDAVKADCVGDEVWPGVPCLAGLPWDS